MSLLSSIFGLGLCLLVVALILIGCFFWFCVLRIKRLPETGERRRKGKKFKDSTILLGAVVFTLGGIAVINFGLFLHSYHIFAVGEPIALVNIREGEEEQAFEIQIRKLGTPVSQNLPNEYRYSLQGETWTLQGHVVRFHNWMNLIGVKPVYQLTRLQSGYFLLEDEKANGREVHSLIDESAERWWRWAHANEGSFPGVMMVQSSAVGKDAKPGSYQIMVHPTGFSLEPAEVQTGTLVPGG